MRFRRSQMPTREAKLAATLRAIRNKIHAGSADPKIFRLAREAVREVPEFDDLGEVHAVANAIKSRVRFTRDPYRIEAVADAGDTLELGTGDCDDLSVAVGAALQSIGFPVDLQIVGQRPGRFDHVMISATLRNGKIIPIDLARPDRNFFTSGNWGSSARVSLAAPFRMKATGTKVKSRARKGGGGLVRMGGPAEEFEPARTLTPKQEAVKAYNQEIRRLKNRGGTLAQFMKAANRRDRAIRQARKVRDGNLGSFLETLTGAADTFQKFSMLGSRGSKASYDTIAQLAMTDPAAAQALMAQRQFVAEQKARDAAGKAQIKAARQSAKMGAMATAPAPAPAPSSNTGLYLLGGLGILGAIMMSKGK